MIRIQKIRIIIWKRTCMWRVISLIVKSCNPWAKFGKFHWFEWIFWDLDTSTKHRRQTRTTGSRRERTITEFRVEESAINLKLFGSQTLFARSSWKLLPHLPICNLQSSSFAVKNWELKCKTMTTATLCNAGTRPGMSCRTCRNMLKI